jgi:hypothetical protein
MKQPPLALAESSLREIRDAPQNPSSIVDIAAESMFYPGIIRHASPRPTTKLPLKLKLYLPSRRNDAGSEPGPRPEIYGHRPATPGRMPRPMTFARCRSTTEFTGGHSDGRAFRRGLGKACCGGCAIGSTRKTQFGLNPRHHRHRCHRRPDRPHHATCGSDRPRAFDKRRWRRAASRANRARSPCRLKSR